jgi:hypothetical protein
VKLCQTQTRWPKTWTGPPGVAGYVLRPSRRSPGALGASSSGTGVPAFAASEHVLQASVAEDIAPVLPHLRVNRKSSPAYQP